MVAPVISIVVPALNEQDNVGPLVEEIAAAFGDTAEVIIVDDGSTDATPDNLEQMLEACRWLQNWPRLRVLRHEMPLGQSAAMGAGVSVATAPLVAFLDADLQNDPAELMGMMNLLNERSVDLVQGDRSATRADSGPRKLASSIGRLARRAVIGDAVRDTGCSARVLKAEFARKLPLHLKGMHRFIPAMVAMHGGVIAEYPVRHRVRHTGQTKYGVGVLQRGLGGLRDLLAVRWMKKRIRRSDAQEITVEHRPQ
ncbi:MAG: glycosyltransferase family 2 protein [Planctomycetota bacterium]